MAGKGGGAWKVAYADFVTAMMAFFLVMWITGQSQEVREAIATYFEEVPGMRAKPGFPTALRASPNAPGGRRRLPKSDAKVNVDNGSGVSDISDAGLPKQPPLRVLHDGTRSSEGVVVVFQPGSNELTEQGRRELAEVVPLLIGKRNKVEVKGHVSSTAGKTHGDIPVDQWTLCFTRCLAVSQCMVEMGMEPDRVRLSQASEFEPFSITDASHLLALNDRVEVYMLSETVEDTVGTRAERKDRIYRSDKTPDTKLKSH